MLRFEVTATDGAARRGRLHTPHGVLQTPAFVAVATRAALKGLDPVSARRAGIEALICNSYHLAVQPGGAAVAAAGGLHRFMGWDGVLATDSGGFQVMSLRHGHVADEIKGRRRLARTDVEAAEMVRVDEDGADFRSYVDGSRHRFTPEANMALQGDLGADLLFCLDECTPFHVSRAYTEAAAQRNARWAERCLRAHRELGQNTSQALYGIVHGGIYPELRRRSAAAIVDLDFPAYAIGDCLGATKADWYRVVELVCPLLPPARPRHLLGVGEPDDLVEGALRGVDTFDCAMPTRIARHGLALCAGHHRFRLDLGKAARRAEDLPIEGGCPCSACSRFGRAYLHHLVRSGELLGIALLAEHNLAFTARLMGRIREAIEGRRLGELRAELMAG